MPDICSLGAAPVFGLSTEHLPGRVWKDRSALFYPVGNLCLQMRSGSAILIVIKKRSGFRVRHIMYQWLRSTSCYNRPRKYAVCAGEAVGVKSAAIIDLKIDCAYLGGVVYGGNCGRMTIPVIKNNEHPFHAYSICSRLSIN